MTINPSSNEFDQSPPPDNTESATELSCDDVVALIPAYVVGATDPEEAALVRAQLVACPQAVRALAGYETLMAAMLHMAQPVTPPARLENRLRRTIGQPLDRQLFRPQVRPSTPRMRWRWSITWAAAALTALLLLAGLNAYWLRQNLQLRAAYAQLAAQRQNEVDQENSVYVLLASDERRSIELPAAQEASRANAEIIWDPEVGVAMLYAKSFPPLAPDQVYQLWLTANGKRSSGGLFNVDQNGTGVLIFPLNQPLDGLDSLGITPEPAGGSPGPTAPPVVRRRLRDA